MRPDWLVPQWPAPARVHAVCTTRAGGRSMPPYDSLNLGDHVGDDPLVVDANRAVLHQVIGAQPVFLSQVHGAHVEWLCGNSARGTQADACITDQPGIACTIMVADCLPVLFTNLQGSLVAAAHAGWRGLAGQGGAGILEAVYERFGALALENTSQEATKIIAWLGPCIGPEAFEVGNEVRDAFVAHDRAALAMFTPASSGTTGGTTAGNPGGKWLADLPGLARLRLAALGVTQIYGNDSSQAWCTFSNPSRFFSYRRDRVSGRMAACIWLD